MVLITGGVPPILIQGAGLFRVGGLVFLVFHFVSFIVANNSAVTYYTARVGELLQSLLVAQINTMLRK